MNSYNVISVTSVGDLVTVIGTVNGGPSTTVTCWLSYLTQLETLAAIKTYVFGLLLAAQPVIPAVVSQLPTGTFSQ